MLKKWFKSLNKSENKVEEVKKDSSSDKIDISEFVHYQDTHLQIKDYNKKLSDIPTDFFDSYRDATVLEVNTTALTEIPESITNLKNLKNLSLLGGKYRTLPNLNEFDLLERIKIDKNNLINLDKEIIKLNKLPKLTNIYLGSYKGKKFPQTVFDLKNLKSLTLGWNLQKKKDINGVINAIKKMPWLESLNIDFNLMPEDIQSNFIELDTLNELSFRSYFSPDKIPSCIGLFKNASFREKNKVSEVATTFREKYKHLDISNEAKQKLFCFFTGNYIELKELLPNKFEQAVRNNEKTGIILQTKIKGFTKKKWASLLEKTCFNIAEDNGKGNLIYVVGNETDFDFFENLILNNKNVVFKDHLQDLIVMLEDPWLMQDENNELNDQLLKLLASNQIENYKVAFEIIEGGGANKTIQSLLAAIMTTHPDKKIAKKAEQLYEKYGSPLFIQHTKAGTSGSLRRSGKTQNKLNYLLNHPEVDEFVFRLMHHVIATSNPNIKDLTPNVFEIKNNQVELIPEEIKYFNQIHKLHFYSCPNIDLNIAIPRLKQMGNLKHLILNGSHLKIPNSIGELVQLELLEAEQNEFEDVFELGNLVNLKRLNIAGCKIEKFSWLSSLQSLNYLNVSSNKISEFPEEILQLPLLNELFMKQNKLTEMHSGLLKISGLQHIDFSNNAIKNINYDFFKKNLKSLLLRSNKIEQFDIKELDKKGITKVELQRLNLAANKISEFNLGKISFLNLNFLDISNNYIKELHTSVFENTRLNELYASKNQITDIPDSVVNRYHFTKFWIQNNQIQELRESFAKIRIDNADLSNNKIEKMHEAFSIKKERDYSRLYWKMRNNPIAKELTGVSGLYGRS